jgi:hypothetical protein
VPAERSALTRSSDAQNRLNTRHRQHRQSLPAALHQEPIHERTYEAPQAAALAATLLIASTTSPVLWAQSQNQRSFVSSNGSDPQNLCSPSASCCTVGAPCRTFAKALLETAPEGEIVVMNAAGYGPAVITQPVTITGLPGSYGGITASTSGQNGITVAASAGRVSLRGLTISTTNGSSVGAGILVQGGTVSVDNCHVSGFTTGDQTLGGLVIMGGIVHVKDSIFHGNRNGVTTRDSQVRATFDRVQVLDNLLRGMDLFGGHVAIRDSVISGSANNGIYTYGTSAMTLTVERSIVSSNGGAGVVAGDSGPTFVTVTGSVIMGNGANGLHAANTSKMIASANAVVDNAGAGLFQAGSGIFLSAGNNAAEGNAGGDVAGTVTPLTGH